MAAPKAPVLGGTKKEVSLDEAVFAAEIKPHLVHEAVRAELNARRQGTRAAKSRGLVAGGRAKPWRQKGTGRARQGTIRAPQFAGGGVAFPPVPRDFSLKVNKKAVRAALRAALSDHAQAGTLGLVAGDSFEARQRRIYDAAVAQIRAEVEAMTSERRPGDDPEPDEPGDEECPDTPEDDAPADGDEPADKDPRDADAAARAVHAPADS